MDLEFTILLPGGSGVFHFSGPFPVSDRQWQHIRHVMDAMAPGLVTSDDDECPRRSDSSDAGDCSCSGSNPHQQVRSELQNGSSTRQF